MKPNVPFIALLTLTTFTAFAETPAQPQDPKAAKTGDKPVAPDYLKSDPEPEQPIIIASKNALCDNAQTLVYQLYLAVENDAFSRRMIQNWQKWQGVDGARIKAEEVSRWKRVEKDCPPDVVTALTTAYVEWSTKNLKPAPWFMSASLEKSKDDALKEFIDQFAASVRKSDAYAAMVKDPRARDFFARFPLLNDPLFDAGRLTTSIDKPEELDRALAQIKEAVQDLPDPYKTLFREVRIYVSMGSVDLHALCRWENAVACYAPKSDTVYIQPAPDAREMKRDIIHELAHAWFHHLSKHGQTDVSRVLSKFLGAPDVKRDLVRNRRGLCDSWKDKTDSPRYAFVRAYGASDVDEDLATYVEDLLTNDGQNVVKILQTEYQPQVIETLTALKRAGFFGKQPETILQPLYRKAGLGNEATH